MYLVTWACRYCKARFRGPYETAEAHATIGCHCARVPAGTPTGDVLARFNALPGEAR